ncbi:MAG: hypothetical protein ABW066_06125 [Sedimenticola sp.]
MNSMLEKLKDMWLTPFRLIGSLMEVFISNRKFFRKIKQEKFIANLITYGALITAVVWLTIAMLATDEQKSRLTEAMKELWYETKNNSTEVSPEQPE